MEQITAPTWKLAQQKQEFELWYRKMDQLSVQSLASRKSGLQHSPTFYKNISRLFVVVGTLLMTACSSIGPTNLHRDRIQYNDAVTDSRKEMLLKNIVKLRYADSPQFLRVSSIISGYNIEKTLEVGGDIFSSIEENVLQPKATGKYIDRPTINYAPVKGDDFTRAYLSPLPPKVFLTLLVGGTEVDILIPLLIKSINGIRPRDAQYPRVVELFRILQRSGALSARITDDSSSLIIQPMFLDETTRAYNELVRLLRLKRDTDQFTVGFGMQPNQRIEIALITRSALSMMARLSQDIDVPLQHITEGRTLLVLPGLGSRTSLPQLIQVSESARKPSDSYVAIEYKNHWYWIDDRDFRSKRIFAAMILFLTLNEGGAETSPIVTTISAG